MFCNIHNTCNHYKFSILEICDQFPTISSGSYIMTSNGITSSVTVQCDTGYYLSGEAVVTCADTGTWSHSPSCCMYKYMFL